MYQCGVFITEKCLIAGQRNICIREITVLVYMYRRMSLGMSVLERSVLRDVWIREISV